MPVSAPRPSLRAVSSILSIPRRWDAGRRTRPKLGGGSFILADPRGGGCLKKKAVAPVRKGAQTTHRPVPLMLPAGEGRPAKIVYAFPIDMIIGGRNPRLDRRQS